MYFENYVEMEDNNALMTLNPDELIAQTMKAIFDKAGSESLTAESMARLGSDEITLWGYHILHEEVMDGGFIQLIHNGYGPFFFDNPFAKAMKLWGLTDLSKLIYKARKLYLEHRNALVKDCSDEEFMALYEQYPKFDDLDDEFVTEEEGYACDIAEYIRNNQNNFLR